MISFQDVLKRVEKSSEFKKFKEENEEAYLCSGFFVIDFESPIETKQIDYYLPSQNKMASFLVDADIKVSIDGIFEEKKRVINKINPEIKIEIDGAIDMAKEVVKAENQKGKRNFSITKIIAILHKTDEGQVWNLTCMLGGTDMMLVHVDSETGKVVKNVKASLLDFMRRS